jgi:uncharacterized membrane protein
MIGKSRLEAFSDGVIAIIITIMVLEMKVPHGDDWAALTPLWPVFLSYVLSFVNVGIYWNNHHHMVHTVQHVTAGILWCNLHLLFWLSLMPFVTGWMGENHFAALPTAVYGFDLLACGFAYWLLQGRIVASQGERSALRQALGADFKGKAALVMYLVAVPVAFVAPAVSGAIYAAVALMWLVPDRRVERVLTAPPAGGAHH